MPSAPVVPLKKLISSFDATLGRLGAVPPDADNFDGAYGCVFEALNWAVAISDVAIERKLTAVSSDSVVMGIRAVRNPVHHQLAEAINFHAGAYGEGAYGIGPYGGFKSWTWKPLSEIPEPPAKHRKEPWYTLNRQSYESHVASRIVLDSLDKLSTLFATIP
jgi:hypothetical protein